jgi:NAD(P)-dependent dehydrogenase (short-subunit alcohol dehydrogenase family)
MMGRIDNKVALITGGSSGIGRAAARLFAQEGAKVVIADINIEGGEETLRIVREAGCEALFVRADVSRSADIEALIDKVVATHGRLDCAYNNAGVMGDMVSVTDLGEEAWDHVIETNLKGTWMCMKHQISQMLKQGHGVIVNTTASAGVKGGSPHRSAYAASKAGIVRLSKSAAMEYAEYGLRINVICPSHTRTPMLEQFFEMRPDLEADFIAQAPMGRIATPEEVAEAALWLCSDASSFVTGHVLAVDGGYLSR